MNMRDRGVAGQCNVKRVDMLLFVMLAVFIVSRLYHLTVVPPISNESIYILVALNGWRIALTTFFAETKIFTIGLYALLMPVVHDHLWVGRSLSVLAGTLSLVGMYKLFVSMYSRRIAALACVFWTVLPLVMFFTRFASWESWQAMFGTLITLQSYRLARKPSVKVAIMLGGWMLLALLVNISSAGYALIPMISILAYRTQPWRAYMRMLIAAYAFLAPILAMCLGGTSYARGFGQGFAGTMPQRIPSLHSGWGAFILQICGTANVNGQKLADWLPTLVTWPILLLCAVGAGYLAYRKDASSWFWVVVLICYLAPLVFGALLLFPHYLLFAGFVASPLAAYGVECITKTALSMIATPLVRTSVAGLLVSMSLLPSLLFDARLLSKPESIREPGIIYSDYIAEWPSGFGLREIETHLKRAIASHPEGVRVILFGVGDGVNLGLQLFAQEHQGVIVEQKSEFDPAEFKTAIQPSFVVMDDPLFMKASGIGVVDGALHQVLRVEKPGARRAELLFELLPASDVEDLLDGFGRRKVLPHVESFSSSPWHEPAGMTIENSGGKSRKVLVTIAPYEIWLPMIKKSSDPLSVSFEVSVSDQAALGAEPGIDFVCSDRRFNLYHELLDPKAIVGQRGWQKRNITLPHGIDSSCWVVFRAMPGREGGVSGAWVSWSSIVFRN